MHRVAKMMIASDGRRSAVLLDGVMIGVGVDGIRYIHGTLVCNICANNMQMLYRTAEGGDDE